MKTFSEREVAAIIERAIERQAEADRAEAMPGLTLEEIERLGHETGIDPAHLRAAALEVGARGPAAAGSSGTSTTHVFVERWVDGPLTEEAWEDVVAHLRQHYESSMASSAAMMGWAVPNEVQQVGRAREWTHTSAWGVQTRVTVSPRGDRTRLRLTTVVGMGSSQLEGLVLGAVAALLAAVGGATLAVALGAEALGVILTVVLTFLAAAAIAVPAITRHDRRWRAKKLAGLEDLADDLAPILARAAEAASAASNVAGPATAEAEADARPGAARLNLDALPDAPAASVERGPDRTRARG